MDRFASLVEQQVLKALAEGKLSHLEGEGKPLPDRPGDGPFDAAEAAGLRMMAEAGALPEEVRLRKALKAARAAWRATNDPAEKRRRMAEIADLHLRQSIAREARQRFIRSSGGPPRGGPLRRYRWGLCDGVGQALS